MRRKIFLFMAFLLVVFALFYILFVQHEIKQTIHLKLSITAVTAQFSNPVNAKKWFSPFSSPGLDQTVTIDSANKIISIGATSLQIQNESIYSSLYTLSNGKKKKQIILSALPDTGKNSITTLTMLYKTTYFKKWFGQNELTKNALTSFANFNEYLDDTKRVYGYEIKPVKVADTAFLFIRKTVPLTEKRSATKKLFDDLIAYAEKRNADYNGVRIFYSLKSENEITLFASIGVTRMIEIPNTEPYEYKMMPFEKNLIEATYQGPYAEAEKVYAALEAYKEDRTMSTMAIPFQKFISDGYDFADDQIVQMKVYFPVF